MQLFFFWDCLLVVLTLVSTSDAFEFVRSAEDCRYANMWCVPLSNCPQFKTRVSVKRRRPAVCGFERGEALVCCEGGGTVGGSMVPHPEDPDELMGRNAVPVKRHPGPDLPYRIRANYPAPPSVARKPSEANQKPAEPSASEVEPYKAPVFDELVPTPSPHPPMCGQPKVVSPPADGNLNTDLVFTEDAFAVRLPGVNPNILGGRDVALGVQTGGSSTGHRWPWIVLFGRWTDAGLADWFCGGTLITPRHVLTAAHCFRSAPPGAIGVRIGDHDLGLPDEINHQERNVSSVVMHPEFRSRQNDLAVVLLSSPVESSFSVQPICLPTAGAEHVGRDVLAAGWGMLEFDGDLSDILQEVPLRVIDPATCEAAFRRIRAFTSLFPRGLVVSHLCAGSRDEERRDACTGDSGGPLVARREDGAFELVGVIATGVGCGTEFPGLYTKVSAFVNWIASNLT